MGPATKLKVSRVRGMVCLVRAFIPPFAHSQNVSTAGLRFRKVDARGELVGRLAAQLSKILQGAVITLVHAMGFSPPLTKRLPLEWAGKDKPIYSPDRDHGDIVVCVNADGVELTKDKWESKRYAWHTGHNLKKERAIDLHRRKPTRVIERAVYGMLPKNRLRERRMRKLLLYPGEQDELDESRLVPWEMPERRLKREEYVPVLPDGYVPLDPEGYQERLEIARRRGTTVQVDPSLFRDLS